PQHASRAGLHVDQHGDGWLSRHAVRRTLIMVPLADLADSWSSIYSGSPVIKSAVAFAHIGALLAGGGMAIAADRATLAAHKFGGDAMRREADRLGGIHGTVLVSVGIILI